MKTFSRLATTVTAALTAAFLTLFVAAPAMANEELEKYNPADEFSTAGQPLDVVAILVTGAILLVIVLVLAQLIGNLFEKPRQATHTGN